MKDNCDHRDTDHVSYVIGIGNKVWMKCDCGEEWKGEIPTWVTWHLVYEDEYDNEG